MTDVQFEAFIGNIPAAGALYDQYIVNFYGMLKGVGKVSKGISPPVLGVALSSAKPNETFQISLK